jgi:hypothetical protein
LEMLTSYCGVGCSSCCLGSSGSCGLSADMSFRRRYCRVVLLRFLDA